MPQKLIVNRRMIKNLFIKEGDQKELSLWAIEESTDKRGFYLADLYNQNVKFFNREEAASCRILYRSDFCISAVLPLTDGSGILTVENIADRGTILNINFISSLQYSFCRDGNVQFFFHPVWSLGILKPKIIKFKG